MTEAEAHAWIARGRPVAEGRIEAYGQPDVQPFITGEEPLLAPWLSRKDRGGELLPAWRLQGTILVLNEPALAHFNVDLTTLTACP